MDIGTPLPTFNLKDTNGRNRSDKDYEHQELLVIIFTCNHCPYAKAYDQRIKALAEDYKNKKVQFILINSNDGKKYPEDRYEEMIKAVKTKGFTFPYLHDETQEVAKAFGAACTPHVYVFNKDRKLSYEGAIDDDWKNQDLATERYLQEAIEALLTKTTPSTKQTNPIGCSIKWK